MATARPQCSANQESPGFSHGECQDLSQAYEFRRHYWQVVVLPQSEPLCVHNNERPGKDGFEEARLAFLRECRKDLAADAGR